jgi:Protein of unknown function (DUF4230)
MSSAPNRSRLHIWAAIVCTMAVVVSIAVIETSRRRSPAMPPVDPVPTTTFAVPPVARVVDAARALKLVTWTFDTQVDAQSISDRWYGDAVAVVRAPVKYQYGVDLEGLKREDLVVDEPGRRFVFIVPAPRRISAEVGVEQLEQSLKTSGLRWRSANQRHLEEARLLLARRAQEMVLSEEDDRRLRDASRSQLQTLLATVLGPELGRDRTIEIRFAD